MTRQGSSRAQRGICSFFGTPNFRFLALLGMTISFVAACARGDSASTPVRVGVGLLAPAYQTISLSGDTVSLGALRDKVVLLNVWATWCHPCRDEIPELREVHDKYAGRGLELVGVSVDAQGNEDAIKEFMKEFRMNYPVWLDPDERVTNQFLVVGVPATFLIDRKGVLRWRKTGPIQPGDTSLTRAIESALAG
jgi:cytochrome c biogenesis protein CcmG/thiol:disulfide interchange protein DsbE